MDKVTARRGSNLNVETVYVDSLGQFILAVRKFREKWQEEELWFRGVTSSRHRLRPSLYRQPGLAKESQARKKEDEARIEFSRRGHALVLEREPKTHLDWYILMRHNGVPTRLLDWSEGSLIALYFALRPYQQTPDEKPRNAAVWVLDPQWLNKNKKATDTSDFLLPSSPEISKYLPEPRARKRMKLPPVAILPSYLMRQMMMQRSVFTIQGAPDGFDAIASARERKRLAKIVVRHSGFEDIQDDLASCGISEATIFPDFGGLGREVTEFFL
jgi:FRG domain